MTRKLLLADASVTSQRVIELTFSAEDVEVLVVSDGEAAIARIPVDRPDVVLADIGMPKRSGYEVSAFVKGHPEFEHIPVLLLAGAFEPVDEAKAKEARCDGVLVKPFEPQNVIARVRELISGAKGSPTQSAVGDILRPAARLAPPRPVELPRHEDRLTAALDVVDVGEEDLEPRPGRAAPTDQPSVVDDALDDYFDKLDEAFAHMGERSDEPRAQRAERPLMDEDLASFDDPFAGVAPADEPPALPTLDELLAGIPPSSNAESLIFEPVAPAIDLPVVPVAPVAMPPLVAPPLIEPADVSPTITPGPPRGGASAPTARSIIADAFSALLAVEQGEPGATPLRLVADGSAPVITEGMVDDIARRVVERLALGSSDQMNAMVKEIVSGVAERLVREEIERIRSRQ